MSYKRKRSESDAIRSILRKTNQTPGIAPHFDPNTFNVRGVKARASTEILTVLQAWEKCGESPTMQITLNADGTCALTPLSHPATTVAAKRPCAQGEQRRPNPWNGYNAVT